MTELNFEVSSNFNKGSKENEIVRNMRAFLLDLMFEVEKEAKLKAPVDTGRLRASIHTFPTTPSDKVTVADGVDYGFFQEYGTIKMRSQPFMRPALQKVLSTDVDLFAKKHKLK